jgi:hypothetical protein
MGYTQDDIDAVVGKTGHVNHPTQGLDPRDWVCKGGQLGYPAGSDFDPHDEPTTLILETVDRLVTYDAGTGEGTTTDQPAERYHNCPYEWFVVGDKRKRS